MIAALETDKPLWCEAIRNAKGMLYLQLSFTLSAGFELRPLGLQCQIVAEGQLIVEEVFCKIILLSKPN